MGKETLRKHNLASTVRVVEKAGNSETMKEADFRNLSFLNRFTSDAGQLPPRRVTKLKKKVHTHLARQVKVFTVHLSSDSLSCSKWMMMATLVWGAMHQTLIAESFYLEGHALLSALPCLLKARCQETWEC